MVGRVFARLRGDIKPRRQLAEGAVQGGEGAEHHADVGRDRQLETGGQPEQVGEHVGARGGAAREVPRDELPESPLQLVFVKFVRPVHQLQQCVTERRGVAAPDG